MFENMSPSAVAEELGRRIKRARLNANVTQKELSEATGLSLNAIKNAEKGKSQLDTFIIIVMQLGFSEQLSLFIPEQSLSPMQLLKMQGKQRKRASSSDSSEINEKAKW
ncbi:helix-turn-helix domain-containing protein [Kangiella sp. HZ709]|uniref:helix-turn-helix domain-containing protein n=1 Tax=Kangiella sp. HZ709 TaxID=2666328 RepID=UPI0012AF043A|nr:helix-turn-helix transcriptional regulator [Kangiella sp. HZ709]MRX27242.1 helix-turn-helix domain-containing protein [Kangiella sp. HZ709]